MNNTATVSYCIPIFNEEAILLSSLKTIKDNLDKILGEKNYEILLVDNGSSDNTFELLKSIKDENIKIFHLDERGQGFAYRKAISKSKKQILALCAIDIPFGFDDLRKALGKLPDYDIVFASKAHPDSKIKVPQKRLVSSKIYRLLLKLFFQINITDTQGTVFMKKKSIMPILDYCDARSAFFTAQIALYGNRQKLKMVEIPVTHNYSNSRKSRYNIFKDGTKMLIALLFELTAKQKSLKLPHSKA